MRVPLGSNPLVLDSPLGLLNTYVGGSWFPFICLWIPEINKAKVMQRSCFWCTYIPKISSYEILNKIKYQGLFKDVMELNKSIWGVFIVSFYVLIIYTPIENGLAKRKTSHMRKNIGLYILVSMHLKKKITSLKNDWKTPIDHLNLFILVLKLWIIQSFELMLVFALFINQMS